MHYFDTQEINEFDVIIVGAGPSGCACAHELDKFNKKILLVDKHNFPRHKPCAGGITIKALNQLPIDISHLIQHHSYDMTFEFDEKYKIKLNNQDGSCVMVIREDFDKFFFDETLKLDINFLKIKNIQNIKKNNNKIFLEIDDKKFRCNYLIGADGANSVIRKMTTSLSYKNPVYAFEGIVKKNQLNKDSVTEFVFNNRGYGWIFPKKDHLNVGIGNLINRNNDTKPNKKDLYDFVQKKLNTDEISNITGFPIGTEGDNYHSTENIFLVGDAAGLSESLLGEGIYNAIISGQYAAKSIIAGEKHNTSDAKHFYNTFLYKLTKELRLYRKGSNLLYNYPKLTYFLMKFGLGKKFMDGYSQGKTLTEIIKKTKLLPNF
ncbi:MAG: hypothetical protein CMD88_05160 [Gammaproteobacteria bacterium]|nr:hypothetical protein [Gammaproteobacteria bacterium]|tara:strand:- start:38479 stop:39606 length:1128 start_codon:yes stop_codon:yes gene_type:complete